MKFLLSATALQPEIGKTSNARNISRVFGHRSVVTLCVLLTRIRADFHSAVWLALCICAGFSTVIACSFVDPNQTVLLCSGPILLCTTRYVTERSPNSTRDHQCKIRAVIVSLRLEKILNLFKVVVEHNVKTR